MDKRIWAVIASIFILGWLCGSVYSTAVSPFMPASMADSVESPAFMENPDRASPHDWVEEGDIRVFEDKVVINIKNPQWASFYPTRSMDPVFDKGANAIQIVPESPADIHVGDIISYESSYVDGTVIHRVIDIDKDDNEEWFAITKGDNNEFKDPDKVRFDKVKKVLVAIIY